MKSPSKMNNAQLRVALAEAKQDVNNTGSYWKDIANSKDLEIKEQADTIAGMSENVIEFTRGYNLKIDKRDNVIKELTDKYACLDRQYDEIASISHHHRSEADSLKAKLTASDQQCQEYKSMAEHCGADEIKELTDKCTVLEIKLKQTKPPYMPHALHLANLEIDDLQVKNKRLVDELAKLNQDLKDVQTISDSVGCSDNALDISKTRIRELEKYTDSLEGANARMVDTLGNCRKGYHEADIKIDALETQIKNQSGTILRMAGQLRWDK